MVPLPACAEAEPPPVEPVSSTDSRSNSSVSSWNKRFPPITAAAEDSEQNVDWVDQFIDLFDPCNTCNPSRLSQAAQLLNDDLDPPPRVIKRDYAKLHDEFLESLMHEAQLKRQVTALERSDWSLSTGPSYSSLSFLNKYPSSSSSLTESQSLTDAEATFPNSKLKRRRPHKMHRRFSPPSTPTRPSKRQVLPTSPTPEPSSPQMLLAPKSDYPEPETFLHGQCRLQKDKGKGETPGKDVCAKGKTACLNKLRQKMELLTTVAFPDKPRKGGADMKRKKAKVVEETPAYTETRSLLELRMGFLSLQYGVLLRWDSKKSGKVTLVVLRKMCSDSFYTATPAKNKNQQEQRQVMPEWHHVVGGNHAILQRADGTEVALLEEPYRVERPIDFNPSRIAVHLVRVEGLSESSQWNFAINLDETQYRARLVFDEDRGIWFPKEAAPFEWEMPPACGELSLEMQLWESKRPARKRLYTEKSVPLGFFESSTRIAEQRQICVSHQDAKTEAKIILKVYHQSDYAYWLNQELEARTREEVNNTFRWKLPLYRRKVRQPKKEEEEDLSDFWNMCCVC